MSGKYTRKQCNSCLYEYDREYKKNNPEKFKNYNKKYAMKGSKRQKQYRSTIVGKCKSLVHAAKQRSNKSNLCFELTHEIVYVMMVAQNMKCAQTGVDFTLDTSGTNSRIRKLTAPSLDRKNNNEGYTIENTQIVCWFYNAAKGTHSDCDVWKLLNETFRNKGFK